MPLIVWKKPLTSHSTRMLQRKVSQIRVFGLTWYYLHSLLEPTGIWNAWCDAWTRVGRGCSLIPEHVVLELLFDPPVSQPDHSACLDTWCSFTVTHIHINLTLIRNLSLDPDRYASYQVSRINFEEGQRPSRHWDFPFIRRFLQTVEDLDCYSKGLIRPL